jgi:hypothetical protein
VGRQWQVIAIIIGVQEIPESDLFFVAQAAGGLRFLLCSREGGQKHGRQNSYDGNDDKQFNQGEGSIFTMEKEFHPSRACCKRTVLKQLKVVHHIL